ncbi:MAG: hypothetical protein J1F23_00075 [Oscillospiraceae bacterium]|nr:hypothetical protein [Oscillospiraceae bacterium]
MKIRGKYKKINPLYIFYVVLGFLAVAAPVRMYQLLNIIESDTGFYKATDGSVYFMHAVFLVAAVVIYVLVTLAKDIPASKAPYKKSILLAICSFLFALGLILDVITLIASFGASAANSQITASMATVPTVLELVFGTLSAIYIMVVGISYLNGRIVYLRYKFLALTPLFWSMSRIVMRFVRKIAYINVSDLMLEIFALVFMMIFFLSFARISSGLSNDRAMRSLFASGFVGVLLSLTANIPRLIMLLTGHMDKLPNEYPFAFCDFAFALFALAYILHAIRFMRVNDSSELNEIGKQSEKEASDNISE